MSKDLIDKINSMDNLSQSQIDRMNKNIKIQDNLFGFLDSQIRKVVAENSLKNQLLIDIKERMDLEGFENIPWVVVLKLLEIYSKEENEIAITLLNMIKEIQIKNLENDGLQEFSSNIGGKKEEGSNMSKEEVKKFKNLYDFLKSVEDSELPDKK